MSARTGSPGRADFNHVVVQYYEARVGDPGDLSRTSEHSPYRLEIADRERGESRLRKRQLTAGIRLQHRLLI